MSIKAKIEALIYAAEEPIGLDQLASLLKDDLRAMKEHAQLLAQLAAQDAAEQAQRAALEAAELARQVVLEGSGEASLDSPEQGQNTTSAAEGTGTTATTQTPEAEPQAVAETGPPPDKKAVEKSEKAELRALLKPVLEQVINDLQHEDRGIEIRKVAGGYRMSTKPEHHDVVRSFAKSLKPPIRLSLQALETLAVIAYKQPVTIPEINDIRSVDSSGVIGTLFERKLITTAGRKAVVGRPMLYKTTRDFLMRFGLSDLSELPSIEEFEKLAASAQEELFPARDAAIADATGIPEVAEEESPDFDEDADADDNPGIEGEIANTGTIHTEGETASSASGSSSGSIEDAHEAIAHDAAHHAAYHAEEHAGDHHAASHEASSHPDSSHQDSSRQGSGHEDETEEQPTSDSPTR